jgi:hypothetical protein
VTREWKLILSTERPGELYHLAQDPGEARNLHGEPSSKEVNARLIAMMKEWAVRAEDGLVFSNHFYPKWKR